MAENGQELGNSLDQGMDSAQNAGDKAGHAAGTAGKVAGKAARKAARNKAAGAAAEAAADVAAPELLLVKIAVIAGIILFLIIACVIYGVTGPGMTKTEYLTPMNEENETYRPETKEKEEASLFDKEEATKETAELIDIIHSYKDQDKEKEIDRMRKFATLAGCDPDLTVQYMTDETGALFDSADGVSASNVKTSEKTMTAWCFLKANGYSDAAAAGIMGNLQIESGFNPNALNSIGAYGIVQWMGGRKANLYKFAAQKGKKSNDFEVQLDFMLHEFNNSYKYFSSSEFKNMKSVSNAADKILLKYEIPCFKTSPSYPKEYSNRVGAAKGFYNKYKGINADGKQTGSSDSGDTSSSVPTISGKQNLATKIVETAKRYSWPEGTSRSKFSYTSGTGYGTYNADYKAYMKKYNAGTKIRGSHVGACCCHYSKFVITMATGKKSPNPLAVLDGGGSVDKGSFNKFKKVGFTPMKFNGSISQLQAGDILVYKRKSGGGHVVVYIGNGKISHAGLRKSYPRIGKLSLKLRGKSAYKNLIDPTILRPNGGPASTSGESVQAAAVAWAKKIAKENKDSGNSKYPYKKYTTNKNTQKCNLCHPGTGKGWNCIGFVAAAYHHGGGLNIRCSNDFISDGWAEGIFGKSDDKMLTEWKKRTGIDDWTVITNDKKRVPQNQLQAGDIILCFSGADYKHMCLYIGGGDIAHSTSGPGASTKKYSRLGSTPCIVFRYTGTVSTGNGAPYVTREDFDVLAAYSVSVGNSELYKTDEEEAKDGILTNSLFRDFAGKTVPLYWFGENAGLPNYKKDIKQKLKDNLFKNRPSFYKVVYEKTSEGGYDYGVITNEDGTTTKYLKATLKERDVTEEIDGDKSIAECAFGVVPGEEYQQTGKTNETAIKGIGEESYELLADDMVISAEFSEFSLSGGGIFTNPLGKQKYVITSWFGGRPYPGAGGSTNHGGMDLALSSGSKIYAADDGVVTLAGWNGGYGNCVIIKHSGSYETLYGHQSKIAVKKGQRVLRGQLIGYVGSTGNSTGPHLHFEVHKNGQKVDPAPYIGYTAGHSNFK